MTEYFKKIVRSVQVYFPFIQDLRFKIQLGINSILGNPHEEDFTLLKKFPDHGELLFIDIGSNRGEAIQSMLTMKKNCRIIGFEPNHIVYIKTAARYRNFRQVLIHNCGLGPVKGEFILFLPFFRNYMFDGLASFKKEEVSDWLKNRIFGYRDKHLRIKEINCELNKLDNFDLSPYFVKIDVQGFEFEVLQGGFKTIEKSRPILLIEAPNEKVISFLADFGYQQYNFHKKKLVPGRGILNTFFLQKDHQLSDFPFGGNN